MAKKPAPAVTQTQINNAAQSAGIKKIVTLSRAIARAGAIGTYKSELRLFCSQVIEGKGYRRGEVPPDTPFELDQVTIGRKAGLIFSLKPKHDLERAGQKIIGVEVDWDDIVNHFPAIAEALDGLLGQDSNEFAGSLNANIREALKVNPSMHKILNEGFKKAQRDFREEHNDEQAEALPNFGMF